MSCLCKKKKKKNIPELQVVVLHHVTKPFFSQYIHSMSQDSHQWKVQLDLCLKARNQIYSRDLTEVHQGSSRVLEGKKAKHHPEMHFKGR